MSTINRIPYRVALRVLGRILNGDKARMVTLCEIEQGFLLHYCQQGDPLHVVARAMHGAEVLELDDYLRAQRHKVQVSDAFKGSLGFVNFRQGDALRFQKSHPLCPMGYEEALRSLGQALDHRNAQAVSIMELADCLQVEYTVERADFVVRNGHRMALPGRRQESYTAGQLAELIRKGRAHATETVRRSGQQLAGNAADIALCLDTATVLEDHEQYDEADELYRHALGLAPNSAEVHYRLACHLRRRGDHKAALQHVQRAISCSADDGRFYALLGQLHIERKHLAEAAEALQQAVSCDPENQVYLFHLNQAYERLGRPAILRASVNRDEPAIAQASTAATAETEAPPKTAKADAIPDAADYPANMHQIVATPVADDFFVEEPAPRNARSLGQRLNRRQVVEPDLPVTDDAAFLSPFSISSTEWAPGPLPALPAHTESPSSSSPDVKPDALPATASFDGLPTLGVALSTSSEWATPLPPVELPLDAGAASAGLPLSGAHVEMPESPVQDLVPGLLEHAEPLLTSSNDEAVQLAAAIMRAEEMVRAEPHRADLHRKLGFLLARQGHTEAAAAEFRQAVECGRRRIAS